MKAGCMDVLRLNGLACHCRLGVTPAERRRPQKVLADLAMHGNWSRAGLSDRLEDSIDYSTLAAMIRRGLESRQFKLLEAVAETIAALCLHDSRVACVDVRVSKTPPPSVRGLAAFEVCITRGRRRKTSSPKGATKQQRGA